MAEAKFQEGLAHQRSGRLDEAQRCYRQVLKEHPQHFGALYLSGVTALQMKNFARAVEFFDKAAVVDPRKPEIFYNRGIALAERGDYTAALESYDRALSIHPNYAIAYNNRGNALSALKRHEEALASYEMALKLQADDPTALNNRGIALRELKRYDAAMASFDAALRYASEYAEAHYNRGVTLAALECFSDAVAGFDLALQFAPDFADALVARGNALRELKRHTEAVRDFDKAMRIDHDIPFLFGTRLHTRMQIADWRDVDTDITALTTRIRRREKAAGSTAVLALVDMPEMHRKAAQIWTQDKAVPEGAVLPIAKRARGDKIHLGYFSMDFREHPVSSLMVGLVEAHDRSRFHVTGFSYGLNVQDETRKRLESGFDEFVDVGAASDAEIVEIARTRGIDIAIDLAGHTGEARTEIMARRAAPIQVNYLGYPGTMGAAYMDYIVADGVLIPEGSRQHYTEKVVTLPDSYQANDPKRQIADKAFMRAELALPETGFVFCCFNNTYKILPAVFESWMRILKRVPGSVLWLLEDCPGAPENLRKEAVRRGVDGARLFFAPRMPRPEHLARQRAADVFLDTLPYNAHTTASDALWAGLPVLTRAGEGFAARVGASLLTAAGLPELVTASAKSYEDLAVALATQPARLADIKYKLGGARLTCPLFDLPRFARHLEAAYSAMIERYQADQPPDHIMIKA